MGLTPCALISLSPRHVSCQGTSLRLAESCAKQLTEDAGHPITSLAVYISILTVTLKVGRALALAFKVAAGERNAPSRLSLCRRQRLFPTLRAVPAVTAGILCLDCGKGGSFTSAAARYMIKRDLERT